MVSETVSYEDKEKGGMINKEMIKITQGGYSQKIQSQS